ncbi:MAG: alpha/beta fold hydrolase [Segniliparus sp.]|uniref:alpha/beta fold hydrolase n=1 Tax=Segniliparus sp. TaxID=2804064 RepID=UPI003F399700
MKVRTRLRRAAAFAAVLLSGAACAVPPAPPPPRPPQAAQPEPAPFDPEPVAWGPCGEGVAQPGERFVLDCASVAVPLDYGRPDGRRIAVAISRTRAKAAHDPLGPLFVNPGGPGSPGLSTGPHLAAEMPPEVADRFDVIGFDPRGTGRSGQALCVDAAAIDRLAALPDLRQPGAAERAEAAQRAVNQGCVAALGPAAAHDGTEEAARDMESVRRALGAPQISYLGFSYGTFLGAVYAHLYPGAVRAMALDSPVDFTRPRAEFFDGVVASSDEVFDQFATWAARSPQAARLADLRPRLAALVARNPRAVDVRDIFGKLRRYEQWPQLADVLVRALDGLPPAPPKPPSLPGASALRAVWCDDQPAALRVDAATAARLAGEWSERSPIFGASFANQSFPGLLDCAGWPEPARPAASIDATGSAPLLVVSGLHDPNTPHSWAEAFVAATKTGVLLSTARPGHAQYLGQDVAEGCLNRGVEEYLTALRLPAPGTVCPIDG